MEPEELVDDRGMAVDPAEANKRDEASTPRAQALPAAHRDGAKPEQEDEEQLLQPDSQERLETLRATPTTNRSSVDQKKGPNNEYLTKSMSSLLLG